ncbi:MAG: hypothetical protein P8Y00_03965, partial [Deltaproteobacteria bacterium]
MKNVLRTTLLFTIILSIAFLTGHPNIVRAADTPIVIGGSLPLTGKFADTAKWIERGMKFWADEEVDDPAEAERLLLHEIELLA